MEMEKPQKIWIYAELITIHFKSIHCPTILNAATEVPATFQQQILIFKYFWRAKCQPLARIILKTRFFPPLAKINSIFAINS